MAGEQARRSLSVEEAKLRLLAVDAQERAASPASPAAGALGWIRSNPATAAKIGGAALGGLLLVRLLFRRPRPKVVKVEHEGSVAASAKGGLIAAAVTLAVRQLLHRYAAACAIKLVEKYSPQGRQSSPSAPAGMPWEPGVRR